MVALTDTSLPLNDLDDWASVIEMLVMETLGLLMKSCLLASFAAGVRVVSITNPAKFRLPLPAPGKFKLAVSTATEEPSICSVDWSSSPPTPAPPAWPCARP